MPVAHLHVFFGKMLVKFLCPFFNWVLWVFVAELYDFFNFNDLNLLGKDSGSSMEDGLTKEKFGRKGHS